MKNGSRRVALAARLGVVAMLLAATHAHAASTVLPVALAVGADAGFGNATFLSGAVGFPGATIASFGVLDASTAELPPGVVYACPRSRGSASVVPTPTLDGAPCRGGTPHQDATLRFGARTDVLAAGAFTVTGAPRASFGALTAATANGALWVAATTDDGVSVTSDAAFTLEPLGRAATTRVDAAEGTFWYNGTDTVFMHTESGAFRITGSAWHADFVGPLAVAVAPAASDAVRDALDPAGLARILAAARPTMTPAPRVRDATDAVGDHSRVPALLDAALLGRLNGTVGGAAFTRDATAFVRVASFAATLENATLVGTADVRFTASSDGFAAPGDDAQNAPWGVALTLWVVALAALVIVPSGAREAWAAPSRRVARLLKWVAPAAAGLTLAGAAVVWDFAVARALGASAFTLLWARDTSGSVAPLLTFEAIAFLLAWLAVALPVRVAFRRVAQRYAPWGVPAGAFLALVVFTVTVAVRPFTVLALGFLVARL